MNKKTIQRIFPIVFLIILVVALTIPQTVLAVTLTVTNLDDNGPGSLRQAVVDAAPDDVIDFGVVGTITLTSGVITIDKNLNIVGPGPGNLTISGNDTSRIFRIEPGIVVTISDVTIANGTAAAILNSAGNLTIDNSILRDNGGANHGAIAVGSPGVLTITNSTISHNTSDPGFGGGIGTAGVTTITGSLFSNNSAVSTPAAYSGAGGAVYNATDARTTTITESCFENNTESVGFDVHRDGGSLTAENNWWGVSTGPNTGGETTNVGVTSFLTSRPLCGAVIQTDDDGLKVTICHIPPGNPENTSTITIGESAVPAHLAHGDTLDACPDSGSDKGGGKPTDPGGEGKGDGKPDDTGKPTDPGSKGKGKKGG